MKWLLPLCLALGLAACGDQNHPGQTRDAGSDGTMTDAGGGSDASNPFASCLDRPDQADSLVPRPPTAGVPCDLIPPVALH
jgi:hypothetical protein